MPTRESVSRSQQMVSPMLRIALLVGVAVHLAGFLFLRVVSNPLPDREPEAAFVQFLSSQMLAGDAGLEEQAILFDSAPLFIPTRWNASSQIFAGIEGEDWRLPDFEPAIDLGADLQPSTRIFADGHDLPNRWICWRCVIGSFFEVFIGVSEAGAALPATARFAEVYLINQRGVRWGSLPVELEYSGATAREPVDYYVRVDGVAGDVSVGRV